MQSETLLFAAHISLYSYRIHIKQNITSADMRKRVITYQCFCDEIGGAPDIFDNVWYSDEAHFLL